MALEPRSGGTDAEADVSTEALVTFMLLAAAAVSHRDSVRKTTLAALLDAVEEEAVDSDGIGNLLNSIGRVSLTDVLLDMRERGVVRLTDTGFTVVDQAQAPAPDSKAQVWLKSLVSKKFEEWQLRTALA